MATNPKPSRSALDLFLLMVVGRGIASIYDLREELKLSVGATQPALARLSKGGLLARRRGPNRAKVCYSLTPAGEKALASEWRSLVQFAPAKPFADTETIMRLVCLAVELGSRRDAIQLLDRARRDRLEKAAVADKSPDGATDLSREYRRIISATEIARLKAEAAVFLVKQRELARRRR